MGNFFTELKRRHIYRVAAAYAVVAWVLLQVVTNVAPALRLPDWSVTLVVVLLAVGFPVALIFAWVLELRAPGDAARTGASDWALAGAAAGVIAIFAYQQLGTRSAAPIQEASVIAARQASAAPAGISVAVLPFVNLSSDKEQEFFSDGITEEITAALAKVPDLRVVGRTSAFQFKDQREDLRAIGLALSATHLLEGSVRKAGDTLRITAQLIKADDGTHLWAENYDRQLTDVFAIQEDIARAIAAALRMPLGIKLGENLVANRNIDADSYEQFLRGKSELLKARTAYAEQLAILEPVVQKNPNYAPAWAALAQAYRYAAQFGRYGSPEDLRRAKQIYEPKMIAAARRAVELDPNFPDGKVMLARIQTGSQSIALSEDLLSSALALDPYNPGALDYYASLLAATGRIKEAVSMRQRVHEIEPFAPLYTGNLAEALWLDGQNDAAISLWKENLYAVGAGAHPGLALIYASLGRYKDAADIVENMLTVERYSQFRDTVRAWVPLMRSAPAKAKTPEKLPRFSDMNFVYLYIGAPARALEPVEESGTLGAISHLWHPTYAPVRKMDRFKNILRNAGLVEYWRQKGWPEQCHPTTGDDFECS